MSDQEVHTLAAAYAQVMLLKKLNSDPHVGGTTEDIRELLGSYFFAVREIEKEFQDAEAKSLEH